MKLGIPGVLLNIQSGQATASVGQGFEKTPKGPPLCMTEEQAFVLPSDKTN